MYTDRARQKGEDKEKIFSDFQLELADVFCHALLLANHFEIDLLKNIKKKRLVDAK
jgi:NTP pyrophosphatase (non-canonical NTP hydrolase)